jgi:transcriptional regulator with XRE-family HTH domain
VPPALPRERRALANAIRELRARKRLTQEQVAEAAGLGRGFLTDLESGRRRASFEAIVLITRGMDVSMGEFVRLYEDRLAEADEALASRR